MNPGDALKGSNGADGSAMDAAPAARAERWRRSEDVTALARSFDPSVAPLPQPVAEIERILREYACECYAVGRGESMYYLVEDLPRLAREAAQEILSVDPDRSETPARRRLTRSAPSPKGPRVLPKSPRVLFAGLPQRKVSAAKGTAKSLVAALPFIAILAVIGLTIGLTFREFVGG